MKPIIDLHCHPTMKPFGYSFNECIASKNQSEMSCPWHDTKEGMGAAFIKDVTGIAPFRQADFNTLNKGNVKIVCCSLYPLEKGFFVEHDDVKEFLLRYVTALGKSRIENIRSHKNYFENLKTEYEYLKSLVGQTINFNGEDHTYFIAKKYSDIETFLTNDPPNIIINIITIEGAHVFNSGIASGLANENKFKAKNSEVLQNVQTVKDWEYRPLFITMAHHFYNELCGHARSLSLGKGAGVSQELGINTGFTPLGFEVIDALLDNINGKRIYIDIKHMSRASRKTYFNLLKTKYKNEDIPVIVSHGAVTGFKNESEEETFKGAAGFFRTDDINFYDEEIIEVAKTNGVFGLQLDERRIASAESLNSLNTADPSSSNQDWAKLLWRQIQHIGQVLDNAGLPAWDIVAMGTDFDGVIKPMGNYFTAEELPQLEKNVLSHAKKFLKDNALQLQSNKNIQAEEIIDKVFRGNALRFFKSYLKERQEAIV